jgi:sec-independent protein translocase protein TatA
MPNIGPMEIALVLIVALLILGPKKLPDMGRSVGKGMREFKEAVSGGGSHDDEDDKPAITAATATTADSGAEQRERTAAAA